MGAPEEVFCVSKERIGLFLRQVWSRLGGLEDGHGLVMRTASRRLADDLSRLLLRFGIQTAATMAGGITTLSVDGVDSQRRFLQEIGLDGERTDTAAAFIASLRSVTTDPVPTDVVADVADVIGGGVASARQLVGASVGPIGGTALGAATASREPLGRVAQVLGDADLELMAVNDVFWDAVVSVELDGVEEVYDATVLGNHNFIANGIAVHNSIEQDADVVILLHRDRDPAAGREGEADVIVAKHRNGPTKDLVLAFQGHYSRFANMARDVGGF
jgi:replicative DNA helicase